MPISIQTNVTSLLAQENLRVNSDFQAKTIERLTGCPMCNRWQATTGEWCRLAPDDIMALREIKAVRLRAEERA